jgi:predicted ABC-type ATPase
VNADAIARGLSGFEPERSAIQAGRIMLNRLRELAAARADFAFETTMASRSFAPWLARLSSSGYQVHVVFVWVRSPEIAIRRVKARVRKGGHLVPDEVVRRRYAGGLRNFVSLYRPLAAAWRVYDNSRAGTPVLVADCVAGEGVRIHRQNAVRMIEELANAPTHQAEDDS